MNFLKQEYQVKPNTKGYLFKNHTFEIELEPGYHYYWNYGVKRELFVLPTTEKFILITNQEVLTKDNVALRFSYSLLYKISDGKKVLTEFQLDRQTAGMVYDLEQRIVNIAQVHIRNKIAEMESEVLNEKRNELTDFNNEELKEQMKSIGISLEQAQLKDITFPKAIQDLFAKHLEAKIRAKSELENARTSVATARTLKNASELMKGDENIKFFQLLETISKIAENGKHTFNFGDLTQLTK